MVMPDVLVIGAGPAGVAASVRAAELGARTTLVTRGEYGGLAANDGPVPVRTLAHAARLLRGTRQLARYGVQVGVEAPRIDYRRLLARAREVVSDVRRHSALREQIQRLRVTLHERAGVARFVDAHTIESESGLRIRAERIILCTGGTSRRLCVPRAELAATVPDAFTLTQVPQSLIVLGGGMTGLQVASIFHGFGSRVTLFQEAVRILPGEDEDVAATLTAAFRESGIVVREAYGRIEGFERTRAGVRMAFSNDGVRECADAAMIVAAIGWVADTAALELSVPGVENDDQGYVKTDAYLRTSAGHVYAAGDITGRWMLVPQALHDGWVAASNAVRGDTLPVEDRVSPIGGFTEPEYASVGLTERKARETHDVVVAVVRFAEMTRSIIDGRTDGFCKLLVDRATHAILGCHVVGDRAVEIVQAVAIAIAAGMPVRELARLPLSFPTYTGVIGRAACRVLDQLGVVAHGRAELEEAF